MKIAVLILLLITIGNANLFAQEKIILDDLIREALENNPDLKSMENSWHSDLAKVPQAGALPDPQLSLNLMNLPVNSFDFNQEPMTSKQIALMQMFPFPGKQGLRTKVAKESAMITESRYQELKNQLIKNVKTTYYSLFVVDHAIDITRKNTETLNEFVKIAETKYSVGKGIQQDVLRAQVEHSKMMDKLIRLEQQREELESQLNTLLNRPAESPVGATQELEYSQFSIDLDQLKELADENRPLLQGWLAMVRQSDRKVQLAKKDYLPDFSLGVAYSQREILQNGMGGVDFFSGMFSMNLPIYFWRKQSKKVEESRLVQASYQEKYDDTQNQVYSDLDRISTDIEKNERLVKLFQTGIIPQASQSLKSAIAGYQTDKVDFLTLLSNQINLFNFEQDYYRVLGDFYIDIAKIEATVGKQF
jgi:cobalt-zinc-cadmium efflux system outer membrane protein